jgi:uncharacterized metal-binding protein
MTVALVEDGAVLSAEVLAFDAEDLVANMLTLGVDLFICGGIRRELTDEFAANGIRVVNNVVGEVSEVLGVLAAGGLESGHGLSRHGGRDRPAPSSPVSAVDCMACAEHGCTRGASCPVDLGPYASPWLRGQDALVYETGRDVSAESDPKLCRIAELVHFAMGAGYRRIGLAFCWELYGEVETLVTVLDRFFTVVPVCCRIGAKGDGNGESAACNPVAQARLLRDARTDLNVIAGLCMGCDLLFTERSHAPVTTLFVKDRSLAHNPVGAIYTRYHLKDLERVKRN